MSLLEFQGYRKRPHMTSVLGENKVEKVAEAIMADVAPPHCELFDDFGVAVQLVMAVLAFSSLICKWFPPHTSSPDKCG